VKLLPNHVAATENLECNNGMIASAEIRHPFSIIA
jgi:hypothetical protein